MGVSRVCVSVAAACSLMAAICTSPTYAMDRGAAFGVGLGLGLLGSAIAAQRMQQQNRYYQQRRVAYPIRRAFRSPRFAAAPVPKSAHQNISTAEPWVTRAYWNCKSAQGLRVISAHAQHGFIKESYSTRLACGNNQQPAKIFTYLSPAHYVGSDRIEYFDGRKLSFIDYVQVGDFGKPFEPQTNVSLPPNEERELVAYTRCTRIDMQARADRGFATIRESRLPDRACPGGEKVREAVMYRSAQDFQGVDHLTFYSSFKEPVRFNVSVAAHIAQAPPVTREHDPYQQTPQDSVNAMQATANTAQVTSSRECDMFLFKANAFFERAKGSCTKDYLHSKAGETASKGAESCVASMDSPLNAQSERAVVIFDRVEAQRGKVAACELVESVAQHVLATTH